MKDEGKRALTFTDMLDICKALRLDSVTFNFESKGTGNYFVDKYIALTIRQGQLTQQVMINEYKYRELINRPSYMYEVLHDLLYSMTSYVINQRLAR